MPYESVHRDRGFQHYHLQEILVNKNTHSVYNSNRVQIYVFKLVIYYIMIERLLSTKFSLNSLA